MPPGPYSDLVLENGNDQVTCLICGSVVLAVMVEVHFTELHPNIKPKKD